MIKDCCKTGPNKIHVSLCVLAILFVVFLPSINEAATVHKQLSISWFNAAPDGFNRQVMGFNLQFPGPAIVINTGDRLVVNVTNNSSTPTSVHFHGIFQTNSFEMDGVPSVTQCLIPPGGSFIYEFCVDGQWGTFWYHSHFLSQISDGMRGALIVNNNNVKIPGVSYSSEYIVQLSDWYHSLSSILLVNYTEPGGNGNEPVPDTILINGIGQWSCISDCSYETISIIPKTKTRLRLINNSAFAVITFYIEGHPLTIIEVDGTDVYPHTVDVIRMNIGQRYSVVVSADGAIGRYEIHALFDQVVFAYPSPQPHTVAYLEYVGATELKQVPTIPVISLSGRDLSTAITDYPTQLHPYPPLPVPNAYFQIPLTIAFHSNANNVNVAYFNGISFSGPMNTTLTQLTLASQPYPTSSHVISINFQKGVDFVIYNNDTGEHPIHIHGHNFRVLGMGQENDGPWDATRDVLQLINPIQRDTASVNPGSWLYLRLFANNPGLWMFHCHISWHSSVGLGLVLCIDANQIRSRLGTVAKPAICAVHDPII